MYKKKYYDVDRGLTLLFQQIYGEDEKDSFEECATLSNHKRQFVKLITTIKKSFNDTCYNTDGYHLTQINSLCNKQIQTIKKVKSIKVLYNTLLVFFPKLCFSLIGNEPQNWVKRQSNKNKWVLNEFRQIEYKQSKKQKEKLLIEILSNRQKEELKSYKEEFINYNEGKLKDESFISWFIRTYPLIYIELFDRVM